MISLCITCIHNLVEMTILTSIYVENSMMQFIHSLMVEMDLFTKYYDGEDSMKDTQFNCNHKLKMYCKINITNPYTNISHLCIFCEYLIFIALHKLCLNEVYQYFLFSQGMDVHTILMVVEVL